ncbi:ATP-binding protein [Acidisoma sp.]|uniref:ATP-binding protein n=1 Tax=Acidisoma sp. TaxID=1872115 RepID=UPI003AFF9404
MQREPTASGAIILAPLGRDATVAQSLLREAGVSSTICNSLDVFGGLLGSDVCFALLTEEAVASVDLRGIAGWVASQPSWSDLPFIVLTQRGGGPERNPAAARLSDILGNVTFLERPFHPTTFVSVARTALKGRDRQYEARRRIEELHESEARLRTALLAGHLGAWELDLGTWTLLCSETCKAVFGRKPDEPFSYIEMVQSVFGADRRRMDKALRRAIDEGVDYAIEYRTVWPDGSIHWGEARARILRDREGGPLRLVGVCSDITARKASEDSWRQLNETLEQRVGLRTAELEEAHRSVLEQIRSREEAEERLRQSQKLEMIGQLTGGVAHDFNNLLMAILSNLDLLGKYIPPDSRESRLVDGALQGARRGATLTQRLLAFARNQDLNVEPVDMSALLNGMLELLERSVGSSVEMRIDVAEDLPPALADANQIEMALLNLALNARDAMAEGGKLSIALDTVRVEAVGAEAMRHDEPEGLAPGRYLRLIVTDTGHGMDRETLARAIDPFFTTKGRGKGTGLGLSTIHGLAVQLKGTLHLASVPGRGTRAELWLPASSEWAAPQPAAALVATDAREKSVSRATILIVDDDALIAMSTAGMLEDLGHEVIEAHSGAKAVALLRDGPRVDLMITDFSMPGMTGLQLAEAARKLRPELPILLATGYAELPSGETISLPRLGKPYKQSQLEAEISKLLAPSSPLLHSEAVS